MNLKEVLSKSPGCFVSLNEITKNTGTVLQAVTVRPADSHIAPNNYLEGFYKKKRKGQILIS
jgi:hypothetical protein